jgi:rhamnose transport system permease protein
MKIPRELVPGLLIIVALIVGHRLSDNFLDLDYLFDTTSLYAEAGFLALGMTLVIVSGQIDLSVASTLTLVACVAAKLMNMSLPIPLVVVISMLLGLALGAINGLLVARLKFPSFVVTLATMAAYRGTAQVMLGPKSEMVPASFVGSDLIYIPGTHIPLPLVLLVIASVAVAVLLHKTVFGRWVYTVGTNERASYFSGVPTPGVTTWVFALSGLCAAVGGLLIDSRLGVARFDHAQGLELDVITAVVLGGASIFGGKGSVLGTLLALALIGLLRTELGLANVTAEYQLAAVGTLLIASVLIGNWFDHLSTRRKIARANAG